MSCAKKDYSSLARIAAPIPVWVDWPWPEWLYRIRDRYRWLRGRHLQRSALTELDDRLLSDIGITREEALREARTRFWTR